MPPTRHARLGALMICAAAGLALMMHLHPERLRAPAWVAYAAAGAFGLAGLGLLAQAFAWRRLQALLPSALVACLLTPVLWVAVANPLEGRCRMNLAGFVAPAPDSVCRAGFAFGAAIGALMLLLALRHAARAWPRRGGRREAD